jgi:ssDNA thymidine ADP-ribosyltransferase DarT-like protein
MTVPQNPKIYHITHVDNIPNIIHYNTLLSDVNFIKYKLNSNIVGLSKIKERRLKKIEVKCHAGTKVGEYVPFYFCPRSIMLYILHKGNHPDLQYKEGQGPIVHLEADFRATVKWADQKSVKWAFSNINAGSYLADFYSDPEKLNKINWKAVEANDFHDMRIKEGKQAEFLLYEFFPWNLIEKIGVSDLNISEKVKKMLEKVDEKPLISVEPFWYY